MSEVEKFLFNRKEAAFSLGVSIRSIDYMIASGKLDTRQVGSKVLVTRESLRMYAKGHHPEAIRPLQHAA
jgi:excisionase family DNA binding protein